MWTQLAKYEVERALGEGAFGITYLARDTVTGEKVALKVIKDPHLTVDEFRNEAKSLMELNHPNIIRYKDCNYFDQGPGQRLFYLATEFADGGSLKEKLGRTSVESAVDYTLQMLRGLAECHRRHRLHVDLKPDNVLISKGVVKIADFGLSVEYARTFHAERHGASGYMAPEQFPPRRRLSRRTDIWAAGVILFELVYGHHPFPNREDLFRPGTVPECPRVAQFPGLDGVLRKAIAYDETLRFQTAEEFSDALLGCCSVVVRNVMKAEHGTVGWDFDGSAYDDREWEIHFTAGFKTPPILQVSVLLLDSTPTNEGDRTTRYRVAGEVIDRSKAKIKVGAWCNNKLYGCKISWLALGE